MGDRRLAMVLRIGNVDQYRHLDNERPLGRGRLVIDLPMDELAEKVHALNYGSHRFLCAWLRVRLSTFPDDKLGLAILDLLESGLY